MDNGGFGNFADVNSLSTANDKPRVDDLTTAAARGDFPEVTRLIRDGVGVNDVNIYGRTALQVTVVSGLEQPGPFVTLPLQWKHNFHNYTLNNVDITFEQ